MTTLLLLASQVSHFEGELRGMAAELPLREVCNQAYALRTESQRVFDSLANYDSRDGGDSAVLYALALNLT